MSGAEDVVTARDSDLSEFRASLEALRSMLSHPPFIDGQSPLFADYIVFDALQLTRIATSYKLLEVSDPVAIWFQHCLELHGGLGRAVAEAAQ